VKNRILTSESVTEGHPDKLCDQVADAVLDHILADDPEARVACEVMAVNGALIIAGEISANSSVDYSDIAREVISNIGYDDKTCGCSAENFAIFVNVHRQSPDIAMGVNCSMEAKSGADEAENRIGAGDQGIMFGYACDETPELMPAPLTMAHGLCRRMAAARKSGILPWMRPDGKSQVSVQYDEAGKVARCSAIVLSTQHDVEISMSKLRDAVMETVIKPVIPVDLIDKDTLIYINPTGRFVIGGPAGDSGLTGRKIIVDTYGGAIPHGGGSFSGKDPTKMDRSGAYMARYAAKNIVAAGLASKCVVSLAYAIGVAAPVSVEVDSMGTGAISEESLSKYVRSMFDLRPKGIIETLKLQRPIYAQVSAYGHFGRSDLELPWERTDIAEQTKEAICKLRGEK
jgi:S-adenosylmethionine synthetase